VKQLLDIKPDERKKVTNLFFQNFFDGLGTAFFYAMGIFIFLGNSNHHDALHLYPLVFVIGGFLILIVSPVYVWLESRTRTDYVIYGLGFFVIILVIASYFLLRTPVNVYTGIALLILYQLIYYLRQTQFWGLTALSFNVLQSKRLFSVVSAGDLPAKFIGYTLVFKLLEGGVVTPDHLIYFAIAAYLISYYFLGNVFRGDHHLKHSSHEYFSSGVKSIKFFGNHLIRSMAFLAFFIMFVVFIVDYSFTKVVMHKINEQDADMYFLVSTVLYVGYGVASALKLFVTGRVFQYLGLKWTIILTPTLMLSLIVAVFLISYGSADPNWFYVRLFIFLYISFIIFRDVIGKPVFLSLFQPLSKKIRLKGHNVVKGIAEPLGMVVSGCMLLLYYGYFEEYHLSLFAIALVIPLVLWLVTSVNVRKVYNATLQGIINLRLMSGDRYLLIDDETKNILVDKLDSENEIDVLFALNHLKNYPLPETVISKLIKHDNILIQQTIWEILAENSTFEYFQGQLVTYLDNETKPDLKRKIYKLLSSKAINFQTFENLLEEIDPEVFESLILGWNGHRRFRLPETVNDLINSYLDSDDKKYFCAGLRLQRYIPSENGRKQVIEALGFDDIDVVKSGLSGACGFTDLLMLNRILDFLVQPEFSHHVKFQLSLIGDPIIPNLLQRINNSDDILSFKIIQVIGHIKTKQATHELIRLLEKIDNPDLRNLILDLISQGDNWTEYSDFVEEEIKREVRTIRQLKISKDFISNNKFIQYDINNLIARIFKLLSFLYDKRVVNRVNDGYFSGKEDLKANAIETLNQHISKEHYKLIKPLIDSKLFEARVKISGNGTEHLIGHHPHLNKWSVALLLLKAAVIEDNVKESLIQRGAIVINEILNKNIMKQSSSTRIMERVIMLKKTSLFSETPENILVEVAGLLQEVKIPAGTTLFDKGDKGDCMFIIYSGKVRIHDGKTTFVVFDQNNFFGDLAMLDTEVRSASATTEEDSILFRLDQIAIYELMDDRIEVAQGIIHVLCHRIRHLNDKYVEIEQKAIS